jgi:phosphoglycolate phosphatase
MQPTIAVNGMTFKAALAVFDKDGTLVDFNRLWGALAERCLSDLADGLNRPELAQILLAELGYDPATRKTAAGSHLAVSPLPVIGEAIFSGLVEAGVPGGQSRRLVEDQLLPCLAQDPGKDMILPLGNVRALFERLAARRIRTAIATTDDRQPTNRVLAILGLQDLVGSMVCADDPIALKPDPAAVLHLCGLYQVQPSETMVVGDNPADMIMGRSAGAGLTVGVLSGNSERPDLAPYADVIIETIDQIEVL